MLVWEGLQDIYIYNKKGKVQNIVYGIDALCVMFYIFWCMHCFVLSPEKACKKPLESLF